MERCSRRAYTGEPLSLFELAFLLWCTQGVKKVIGGYRKYLPDGSGRNVLRPVAVGGSVNAYETYVASTSVTDLSQGIWRYLPLSHELVWVTAVSVLPDRLAEVFTTPNQDQHYAAQAAAVFVWACVPYRGEWRYQHSAHKGMLIDVGHISQNFYLAVEALGCGCCAIGGYHQEKIDHLLAVDGVDEFAVLCATVGHIAPDMKAVYDRFPDLRE